jgi:enamine deaminase RidA (YjgF/YER057c/UK114 family)
VIIEQVNPPELPRPSGFSHAVATSGGRLVFLAGQTAHDASGAIVGAGIVAQFEQALGNLLTALAAAGGRPEHLTSLTIYSTDLRDYRRHGKEIGAVWRRLAGQRYPAMAAVGVSELWDRAATVEIQGFAVVPAAAGPLTTGT